MPKSVSAYPAPARIFGNDSRSKIPARMKWRNRSFITGVTNPWRWGIGTRSNKQRGAILPEMLRWLWRDYPRRFGPERLATRRDFRAPELRGQRADGRNEILVSRPRRERARPGPVEQSGECAGEVSAGDCAVAFPGLIFGCCSLATPCWTRLNRRFTVETNESDIRQFCRSIIMLGVIAQPCSRATEKQSPTRTGG